MVSVEISTDPEEDDWEQDNVRGAVILDGMVMAWTKSGRAVLFMDEDMPDDKFELLMDWMHDFINDDEPVTMIPPDVE